MFISVLASDPRKIDFVECSCCARYMYLEAIYLFSIFVSTCSQSLAYSRLFGASVMIRRFVCSITEGIWLITLQKLFKYINLLVS